MMIPRAIPDCWKAHGKETMADPIMMFQMLKTITKEFCFSPGSCKVRGKGNTNRESSTTCIGD